MISRHAIFVFFCCIIFSCPVSAQSAKKAPVTLFSIGKKNISVDEFIHHYRKSSQGKPGEFTKEKVEEYLDLLVNFKLKVEEAQHRGQDTTAAFRKEYNTYREELRRPYLPDTRMLDSLVKLTYNRMKEEVQASHILVNLKPDPTPADTLAAYQRAMELRERVVNGEDFEAVASAYSEDPSARMNKGNLGYFTALQMVFPFEQAAFTTPIGKISLPVRTSFGYHVVKVGDRRPSRGEVEVSHIMLRTGEGHDNEKAKSTIFDIYDQLQKGVSWDELCREYSQDPSSKDKGGRLRPFGVGTMRGVPEFEQAAFELKKKGDISDPVQTQFGWHILRLESQIPLPPLKELEASLKNRVSRDDRTQISRQAIRERMKREFGFTENAVTKQAVFALADSTLNAGQWKPRKNAIDPQATLFTMQNKAYAAGDFLSFAEKNQKAGSTSPVQSLEHLYNQYIDHVQGLLLEEKIQRENPDYTFLLKEYYEGILLFEIMEKEVWNKAAEDSVGQQTYYSTHTPEYKAGERVKATIFSSSDQNIAQLKDLIAKGDSAAAQEFVAAKKIRKESGAFEKTDRPVLSKIEWKTGLFETENNGLRYLVLVDAVIPPGTRTFAEARPAVISDYQAFIEKRWIEQLKKKYPVKVNKKAKAYVFQQLVKTNGDER